MFVLVEMLGEKAVNEATRLRLAIVMTEIQFNQWDVTHIKELLDMVRRNLIKNTLLSSVREFPIFAESLLKLARAVFRPLLVVHSRTSLVQDFFWTWFGELMLDGAGSYRDGMIIEYVKHKRRVR